MAAAALQDLWQWGKRGGGEEGAGGGEEVAGSSVLNCLGVQEVLGLDRRTLPLLQVMSPHLHIEFVPKPEALNPIYHPTEQKWIFIF